jgi:hypothetical protein
MIAIQRAKQVSTLTVDRAEGGVAGTACYISGHSQAKKHPDSKGSDAGSVPETRNGACVHILTAADRRTIILRSLQDVLLPQYRRTSL